MTQGGEALGTSESTLKATENFNLPGPSGGRGQTQLRQVGGVHRSERFLRRERSTQAPVQER